MAVAVSGGRDSTALLHCTLRWARPLGVQVLALHVHHGLQPRADVWMAQVRTQARRWGAGFACHRLADAPATGDSVEAWARRRRYAALAGMARAAGCGIVLLAHHRRDQAETVLLQALRGGGAAGLAAMPAQIERDGIVWARPWLAHPREAIEAYVRRHRLRFVDDDSNGDPRQARNRLRLQVWPALAAAFPGAELALAQVARRAQDAAAVLAVVADADLQPSTGPDGSLDATACLALPPPRRREMLRRWLQRVVPAPVPETLVRRLAAELQAPTAPGRVPHPVSQGSWPAGAGELRLYRGRLRWVGDALAAPPAEHGASLVLDIGAAGRHPVPAWGGCWLVQRLQPPVERPLGQPHGLPAQQGGVGMAQLCQVQMRARVGGERFQARPGAAARSLKKQFQAAAVPAWARAAPLLFAADGALLCVPGLGIDARQWAPAGQPRFTVHWVPDEAAA